MEVVPRHKPLPVHGMAAQNLDHLASTNAAQEGELPSVLEERGVCAAKDGVLGLDGVAHIAVGIEVAGEEGKPLGAREPEDPVRDPLRVGSPAEAVQLDELSQGS